ncbi:capsular biosynthesis protein [Staphylococcus equorum]|uniref:tyrosine-protein phosphatase n=1 Tax=Staphylococcus equorum TaxID=246432 RepID=UPI002DB7C55D|nr:CpsB/CapC family capsule biosynthesis tyrosine phosphatase [Staphylococcus equorum]MEB8108842.1 capsular biosynthesis protein [Staphylococcus equorum]
MIDIHNHILVDVDDGPKNIEESIDLINQAHSEGVTDIVATPHHLQPRYDNNIQVVKEKLNELRENELIKQLGINLYPGQEIRVTDQVIDDIHNGKIEGINNSKYLLVEFPSNEVPHYSHKLFYELQTMGYVPIIAHPERNKAITENLDILFDLVNGGALSQITSSSLLGDFGRKVKKISLQMIDNNLTHFVASDAHSSSVRPFVMDKLFREKSLKTYYEDLERFMENGKAVIKDERISKQQPTQEYKQKKWFGFL